MTTATESCYLDLISKQRYSCRKYTDQQLTDQQLDTILEAARLSPSARNSQPTRLCVIQGAEGLAKIDECTKCRFGAQTVILVAYDKDVACYASETHGPEAGEYGPIDTTIAITNMDNAAASLGLGTLMVGAYNPQKVRELFNVPENYSLSLMLMVGNRADDAAPGPWHELRQEMDQFVTREDF